MSEHNPHRLGEVVVTVAPTPVVVKTETGSEVTPTRSFDAFIYSKFNLEGAAPLNPELKDQPSELGGLPLVAVEKIVVNWSNYRKHVNSIIAGSSDAKDPLQPKELFTEVSPGLSSLFRGRTELRKLRIWWNITTPSLLKLPWELLTYSDEKPVSLISLVRGLPPPHPVPKLPVGEKLRLAFIHEPSTTPPALSEALQNIEHIELIDMPGDPLESLQKAIDEDYELVHFVCDGSLSFADEGYLYLRRSQMSASQARKPGSRLLYRMLMSGYQTIGSLLPKSWHDSWGEKLRGKLNIETLSAPQLSALQRGSQLAVLSLSPPNTDDESAQGFDRMFLPSVFSAFASIGGSPLPMPNIVAQVCSAHPERLADFWRSFYTELGQSHEIEKAHSLSMQQGSPIPIALFLRQHYRQTFKRTTAEKDDNVPLINTELQLSIETLQQLKELSGFEDIVNNFERQALGRQGELQAKLNPWLDDQEYEESEVNGRVTE